MTGWNPLDGAAEDLRRSVRTLGRTRGFTAVASLTLAVGIGAATAIFAVVDGVLLRPLPYGAGGPDGRDGLVAVWEDHSDRDGLPRFSLTPPTFRDLRRKADTFERLAAYLPGGTRMRVEAGEPPEQLWIGGVSHDFFRTLGVDAALGRTFVPEDERPAPRRVAILGHDLWRSAFGADPGIIGREVTLARSGDEEPYTVIGVMPEEFWFPWQLRAPALRDVQLWVPLEIPPAWDARGVNVLQAVGRIRDDVSRGGAAEQLAGFARRLAEDHPGPYRNVGLVAVPLRDQLLGDARAPMLLILGAVGLLLLIACANVANLFLVRGARRRPRTALRAALGAGPRRLVRESVAEAGVVAILGAVVGVGAAFWGAAVLRDLVPPEIPRAASVSVDVRVLAFAAALATLATLLAGAWPALRAGRSDPREALSTVRTGAGGAGGDGGRDLLIVAQVALAVVLLAGAGLLARSFLHLRSADPGFHVENVLTLRVGLPASEYEDPSRRAAFYEQAIRRLESTPGISAAGGISRLPLEPAYGVGRLHVEGRGGAGRDGYEVGVRTVTPGYFEALGIPLLRGRGPDRTDDADAPPVALVNRTLADRILPRGAVGRRVRFGTSAPWREVVGLVGDVSYDGLGADPIPEVFVPHRQSGGADLALVMRAEGDPSGIVAPTREAIRALEPDATILNVRTLEELASASSARERFAALLLGLFSAIALLLAAVGIYAVLAYLAARRTREIGIRMTLGEGRGRVVRRMLLRGLRPAATGLVLGLAAAVVVSRAATSLLYEVSDVDPVSYAIAGVTLLLVAALASWIPARRAAAVDPLRALREE